MKRALILSFAFAIFAPIGFSGCGEETKSVETKKEVTPTGSDTKVTEVKETKTGDAK